MKSKILTLVLLLCLASYGQKQNNEYMPKPKYPSMFKAIVPVAKDAPEWIHKLYSASPNLFEIQNAYNQYYKDHEFVKTIHTQNYKHFIRTLFLTEWHEKNGQIEIRRTAEASKSPNTQALSTQAANWAPVGPLETYESGGVMTTSQQANIYTLAQSKTNPQVLLAASEVGALFKSTDKGENWAPVGEDFFNPTSFRGVEIDPTNANVFYASDSHRIVKSSDGGATWTELYYNWDMQIFEFAINPTNSQIVYAAGWKGLFKSINGGSTWTQLFSDTCWDIKFKTNDPQTLFLLKSNPTLKLTEFCKSTNGGTTFSVKSNGWFVPTATSTIGGARMGITDADPNRIYVAMLGNVESYAIDNNFIGFYRSDNAGESWSLPYDQNDDGIPNNNPGGPYSTDHWAFAFYYNATNPTYDQGFYNLAIDVSDTDPDKFLVGMLRLLKSENGGKTYTEWGGWNCTGCSPGNRHLDQQDILINGNDVFVASDGGIDLYDADLNRIRAINKGINGTEDWGFGQGWNEDVLTGGRYHNGVGVYHANYGNGKFIDLGGSEPMTGFVDLGNNLKVYNGEVGGRLISTNFTTPVSTVADLAMYPQEQGVGYDKFRLSELTFDPRFNKHMYLGKYNNLYKSEDGGLSFSLVHAFGTSANNVVTWIQISRQDPNIMFVAQEEGNSSKLWRTQNGGTTWSQVTLPQTNRRMKISLNENNTLFVGFAQWGNSIYKSTDLGTTWINLTTPTIQNQNVYNVEVQLGTNDGVYITAEGSNLTYYRNASLSDWQLFNQNLPKNLRPFKILPFYKDGKLTMNGTRGFWRTDFFEPSLPVAQPMVADKEVNCQRTEIQFDDYSVLNHAGATWHWNFPGAATVSSASVRNPIVTYTNTGSYSVTLTVTDANGNTSTKTVANMVTVLPSVCDVSTQAVNAVEISSSTQSLVSKTLSYGSTPNMTFTGWIKPNGIQPEWAGIACFGSLTKNVFGFSYDNQLQIHIHDQFYWLYTGLFATADEWNFVAFRVTPTQISIFLNDKKWTYNVSINPINLNQLILGKDYTNNSRSYLGQMEEITLWNRALTDDEIYRGRHLTKSDVTDPNLIAYYQCNTSSNVGILYDQKNTNDLTISNAIAFVPSTAPVGPGTSEKKTITASGTYTFANTGVEMVFASGGTVPNGEVYVTKLSNAPTGQPTTNYISEDNYWIVNNYGTNATFNGLSTIKFSGLYANPSVPSAIKAFGRSSNAFDAALWTLKGNASQYSTASASATFPGTSITSLGQFYFGSDTPQDIPCGLFTTTWNGSQWSNGKPNLNLTAIITGDLSVTEDLEACSLDIQGSADVVLEPLQVMTVRETVTVAPTASMTVSNNSNLIQIEDVNNSGTISVHRNSNALKRLDYTIWSSPVSGTQTLKQFSPLTMNNRFLNYNSSTNVYNAVADPLTQLFEEGRGFLIRMPDNHPALPTVWEGTFTGVPNNGLVTRNLSNFGTGQGFNMIGNPYPSTIDADEFIAQNSASIHGTLYFWRKVNNASGTAYATYTLAGATSTPSSAMPTNIIQAGQGFFVEAKNAGTSSVAFTNDMRVNDNSDIFFRTATQPERHRYWINLISNDKFQNQMMVAYMNGATQGIDDAIDGKNINDNPVSLTSALNDAEYTIQGRSLPFDNSDTVPLIFKSDVPGTFSISMCAVDGLFAQGQEVLIKDSVLNLIHSLNESDYSFFSDAGTFTSRFEIVYQASTLDNDTFTFENVVMYPNPASQNGELFIKGLKGETFNISVFDINGKKHFSQQVQNDQVKLPGLSAGVYLVKIETPLRTFTKKLTVNK